MQTREEYLQASVEHLRAYFYRKTGQHIPQFVRVSIGFTSRGLRSKAIGECWSRECSGDAHYEIFINPNLELDRALDMLVHELCHTVAGIKAKHGPAFRKIARSVGLEGKLTATYAGDELKIVLKSIIDCMPPYPGAILNAMELNGGAKKQTTRMLKLHCADDGCAWSVRISLKNAERGIPDCPCCGERLILEE